jgi:hypothetical protein
VRLSGCAAEPPVLTRGSWLTTDHRLDRGANIMSETVKSLLLIAAIATVGYLFFTSGATN